MQQYQDLINAFNKLPSQKPKQPTFMQIAGYPHYENVCSNILAFYFHTNEYHELGDVLIRSLLECYKEELVADRHSPLITNHVHREMRTLAGNRIDLVIELEDLIIVIENKIFHWLANDLTDYQSHIQQAYPRHKHVFIVLSPRKEEISQNCDFYPLTYFSFLGKIKKNLPASVDNHYHIFLNDFIKTMENYSTPLDKESMAFFAQHWDTIDALTAGKKEWAKQIKYKVQQLSEAAPAGDNGIEKWIYEDFVLVYDLPASGSRPALAIDIILFLQNHFIEVFSRQKNQAHEVRRIINETSLKEQVIRPTGRGFVLYEREDSFDSIDLNETSKEIEKILSALKEVS